MFRKYQKNFSHNEVNQQVEKIKKQVDTLHSIPNLKKCFSFIDLTTLNSTDTRERAAKFADNVNKFGSIFSNMPSVAAICVYPNLVATVREKLQVKTVKIAAVAGCFPSSMSFIDIKTAEIKKAVDTGADEIDVVISIGTFLEKEYSTVFEELKAMKAACGKAHLKVILESGILPDLSLVYLASMIAMEAGADFIKTSTGKMEPAATPEAAWVMCTAIKEFYDEKKIPIGFKPAGGIVTSGDALTYYAIVKEINGEEWLKPDLFRLGASRLANNLLHDIAQLETGIDKPVNHF